MMAASRPKSDQPDRGWNDPPTFNYSPTAGASPRRQLNKRVAFPLSGSGHPGHAVLDPSKGPPILNPVLVPSLNTKVPQQPKLVMSAGLSNTALGSEDLPPSHVLLLPPVSDTATPTPVPVFVPGVVPARPAGDQPSQQGMEDERTDELLARLHLDSDGQLLDHTAGIFSHVLDSLKDHIAVKDVSDVENKLLIFRDRWREGRLSDRVKFKTTQLALALKNGETDVAHHLHLALIVDHPGEVIPWIGAAKKLIEQRQLAVKEKQLLSETEPSVPPGSESQISRGQVIQGQSQDTGTAQETKDDSSSNKDEIGENPEDKEATQKETTEVISPHS